MELVQDLAAVGETGEAGSTSTAGLLRADGARLNLCSSTSRR
jgi:hypothetical protein